MSLRELMGLRLPTILHPDMDFTKGHDKPHIGVQTQGKRSDGGSKRFNLTYDGKTHPHRSPKKGEGVIDGH